MVFFPQNASAQSATKEQNNFFTDISSPPWEAIHHSDAKTHIINACAARVSSSPYRLVFGGSKTGVEMWISNDEWSLPRSFEDSISLKIGDFTFKGMGYYYAKNRIFLRPSHQEMLHILEAVEKGGVAKIDIKNDENFNIPLSHGRHVLKYFRKCVTSMAFADLTKEKHR
ncbi:hypothetical protein FAI41_00865 [Acetobacteraceae bacterium]|nr:hypothetical protein FAI41_00865 [Acetobacteraceae bacterium]